VFVQGVRVHEPKPLSHPPNGGLTSRRTLRHGFLVELLWGVANRGRTVAVKASLYLLLL